MQNLENLDQKREPLMTQEEFELFDKQYGIILIKPDAVEMDVTEYIISEVLQRTPNELNAGLDIVQVCEFFRQDEVELLYQEIDQLDPDFRQATIDYMLSGPTVLVMFRRASLVTDDDTSLISILKGIKGKSMFHWSLEQLETREGTNNFVRGLLPLPGSNEVLLRVVQKIIDKKEGITQEKMTKEEKIYYVQNLVHSPDNQYEVEALLRLLTEENRQLLANSLRISNFKPKI